MTIDTPIPCSNSLVVVDDDPEADVNVPEYDVVEVVWDETVDVDDGFVVVVDEGLPVVEEAEWFFLLFFVSLTL